MTLPYFSLRAKDLLICFRHRVISSLSYAALCLPPCVVVSSPQGRGSAWNSVQPFLFKYSLELDTSHPLNNQQLIALNRVNLSTVTHVHHLSEPDHLISGLGFVLLPPISHMLKAPLQNIYYMVKWQKQQMGEWPVQFKTGQAVPEQAAK